LHHFAAEGARVAVNATTPTVFLVDDDPAVAKALSRMLRAEGLHVETFDSAEAFMARPGRTLDGCLVLDVTMPGIDGIELQRRLVEAGQSMPIVFLTGYGDIPMSVQAIKAGAADFLTKPVEAEVLLAAIQGAVARDTAARQSRAVEADLRRRLSTLTSREREVLAGLAAGKLNKQIAAHLGVVEQTVKFHRGRIMERMRAKTAAELMHMAAQLGIAEANVTPPEVSGTRARDDPLH